MEGERRKRRKEVESQGRTGVREAGREGRRQGRGVLSASPSPQATESTSSRWLPEKEERECQGILGEAATRTRLIPHNTNLKTEEVFILQILCPKHLTGPGGRIE